MSREARDASREPRCPILWIGLFASMMALGSIGTAAFAEEIIFLQDGRTIRADKTEIIGDRVRIDKPAETIELPRSDVLSIHPVAPPSATLNGSPPAAVYPDMSQQMTDKVRREIPGPGAVRGK